MRRRAGMVIGGIGLLVPACGSWGAGDTPLAEEGGAPTTISSTGTGGEAGSLFTGGGGAGGGPACAPGCVTGVTTPFEGLSMYTFAQKDAYAQNDALADCPAHAKIVGFEGHADMKVEPHTCPSCACSPAACALPEGLRAGAAKCPADGATSLPFGPQGGGWEGTCDDSNAIPAWLQCEGVPCVQSLSVPPAVVEACVPSVQGIASDPPAPVWGKAVRECLISPPSGEGCEGGLVCPPEVPPGFFLCVFMKGDDDAYECPDDYPFREVFFAGVEDARACEECSCGPPVGAACAAYVEAFTGPACTSPVAAVTVTESEGACVDVPSGSALGSVEASLVVDVPGSCAHSGGKPVGGVAPAGPVTLCCQGDPFPDREAE